jgi:(R,R)-butanediol dehydrogenase/meso-butanediol dehydrogenase/diacetyl reductase
MKAIVLESPRTLKLMDVPRPQLKDERHVLIQVQACGICGSDLRYWAGENPWALHTLGRHADNPPNMILGHEFAGVVVEVHSPAYEHLLGKRVGAQAFRVCGECDLCKTGRENLCRYTIHIGHAQGWGPMDFYPGAYAEYCLAWADLLHPMPDHASFEEEAMRDILGVAVHAAGRCRIHQGATVLCIGGGPAGLCIAQVARAKGAEQVFVSDPSPLARRVVGQFEAFTVIDPTVQALGGVLQNGSCAAVFDSVGSVETMQEALPLLAESGTYVNLAVHDTPLHLNASTLGSERTITTSSNAYYDDEKEAHRLISSGAVDVRSMITHRFPLEGFEQAFDLLLRDPKEAYKVVFQPAERPRRETG